MTDRPHRTFELEVHVDGDTWEYVLRELERMTQHIRRHGPECTSVGGGYSTGHVVNIRHDPKMTGDQYRENLETYLAGKDAELGRERGQPKFEQGGRVTWKGQEQGGRVQAVTYDASAGAFRYSVKWDRGPTTSHLEAELVFESLPEHYP